MSAQAENQAENEEEKLGSFARVILVAVLTATLVGSALGGGMAQAAQPAGRTPHPHAFLRWSSRYETRHASQGGQTGVATWFRTSRTIHHAVFRVRLERSPYTPTPSIFWGTIRANHWYRLSFTVLVPRSTPVGRYAGSVRLTSSDGDNDRDDRAGLGRPVVFVVQVLPRIPTMPTITWTPAGLGTMTVQQGQIITQTVSFVSNMNLSSVQLAPSPRLANLPHVHLTVVPMVLPSVPANMAVPVTVTISADANAGITVYHGDLHVVASVNGGPMVRLARDLDVAVDVDRAPTPRVAWPSGSPTSYAALTRVATPVTAVETATFQVTTALSNVTLVSAISGHDVTITPAPVASTVAANTPTTISFTITVAPTARTGTYRGVIWVSGLAAGETRAHARHNGLHFVLAVNK
jgi:hypothetical protein